MSVAVIKGVMKTGQMKLVILPGKKEECLNVCGPLTIQQSVQNLPPKYHALILI